jgi:hypothetical protein
MQISTLKIEKSGLASQVQQEYNAPCPRYSIEAGNVASDPVENAARIREQTRSRLAEKENKVIFL